MQGRDLAEDDLPALEAVVAATELFPPEMTGELTAGFLANGQSETVWLVAEESGEVVGFAFAAQEQLADGCWNMLALGVLPERQSKGIGAALTAALEKRLRATGVRILIVDTSGLPAFEPARRFYAQSGYKQEARIRDFWADGDDKITFRKRLG